LADRHDPGEATQRRSPGRNAGALLVGQTLARLIALGFYVVLARLLGPERIGDFAVGVAFGTLVAVFVEPGLNPQLIREGARDAARRAEYAGQALLYKMIAAPVVLAVVVFAAFALGYRGDAILAIGLIGGAVILGQLDDFAAAALAACERLDVSALLRVTNKVATAALAAIVALLGAPFSVVCAAFFGGALLSAVVSVAVVHFRFVPLRPGAGRGGLRAKLVAGLPLALSSALLLVALRIDQAMASLFGVAVADIGGYNNAIKLKEALIMVPAVFALSFLPLLSRQVDQPDELRRNFSRAVHWGLGGAIPIAIGTWVVADALLGLLFGAPFAVYGDLMRWIFVAYAAASLISLLNALVVARHHYRLQAIASGAVLALNVALNLALLPTLGMRGAALATAAAATIGAAVLGIEAVRAGCATTVLLALLRATVASVPMFLVARWLAPVHVLAAIAGGAAVYLPAYVAVGGLGPGGLPALAGWVRARLGAAEERA